MLSASDLKKVLSSVEEPELKRDIISLNMVQQTRIDGASVFITVELTTPACPLKDELKDRIVKAVEAAAA